MNIKIGFLIVIYYSVISLVYFFGISSGVLVASEGWNTSIDLNSSELTSGEVDQGGFFSTGVSFLRYLAWTVFGVGLGADTPSWFQVIFSIWSLAVTILSIMFVGSSIWNG